MLPSPPAPSDSPVAQCPVCYDDNVKLRSTPCCAAPMCFPCVEGCAIVQEGTTAYVCAQCKKPVDADAWKDFLPAQKLGYVKLAKLRAEESATRRTVVTASPTDIRHNAWIMGAYTHSPGCGHPVVITDGGCDTLACPHCGQGGLSGHINIAGGERGDHTGTASTDFFTAAQGFNEGTDRGQLDRLAAAHKRMWNARFMDELVAQVASGQFTAFDEMYADVWGGFPHFLRAKVAPRPDTGEAPIKSGNLSELIDSLSPDSPDRAALTAYRDSPPTGPYMVVLARMALKKAVTAKIQAIIQSNLDNASWWK